MNRTISVKNVGELNWHGGGLHSRDSERGTLTTFHQSFAEELVTKFRLTFVQSKHVPFFYNNCVKKFDKKNMFITPLRVGVKLEEIDEDEGTES